MCTKPLVFVLLCLMCAKLHAQTGPGGVGNSTNNVLWLSGDYDVYTDLGTTPASNGDNVQQWNDRSGNGANALQNTVGNRPNYQTNVLNGLPVLRFTAANGDRILANGVATGGAATIWVVARYTSLPSDNPGLFQGAPAGLGFDVNGGNKSVGAWVDGAPDSGPAGTQVWGRGIQSNGTQQNISQVTVLNANTTYAVCNHYNGSTTINQYVNNVIAGTVGYNGTLQDWSAFGIGSQGNEGWNGDIAEVLAFNTALNTAQRIIIDNYLAAKWGFTLAANDIYNEDDAGFDFDVAGIGQATDGTNHTDAKGSIIRISGPSGLGNNEFYIWGHDNAALTPTTTNIPTGQGVERRLERRWRGSESGNVGSIDVRVDMTGLGPVVAADLVLLVDTDGDGSYADEVVGGGVIVGATAVGGNVYQFDNVTVMNNNDYFTIASVNSATTPLPVELLFFQGRLVDQGVILSWATASEEENDFFTIERSSDGFSFEWIGERVGKGTSQVRQDYVWTDRHPYKGRNYYRLSQTDFDGTVSYFPLVRIDYIIGEHAQVFPNPVMDRVLQFRIPNDGSTNVVIQLVDMLGRVVLEDRLPTDYASGAFSLILPANLVAGTYLVRIYAAGTTSIHNVIVK